MLFSDYFEKQAIFQGAKALNFIEGIKLLGAGAGEEIMHAVNKIKSTAAIRGKAKNIWDKIKVDAAVAKKNIQVDKAGDVDHNFAERMKRTWTAMPKYMKAGVIGAGAAPVYIGSRLFTKNEELNS